MFILLNIKNVWKLTENVQNNKKWPLICDKKEEKNTAKSNVILKSRFVSLNFCLKIVSINRGYSFIMQQ